MHPSTIGGINLLPEVAKRDIYGRTIPGELLERFNIPPLDSIRIANFLQFKFVPGTSDVEIYLFHEPRFPDPILYGHLTDTINGQIHILLYILNDPDAPRFDVDRMPDGTMTRFGTLKRNIGAEQAAMLADLAPGQVRHGLRLLAQAIRTFEGFVSSLGHDIYFVEPLYYHNAVIFERYGFAYQLGRKLMERIENGFVPGNDLYNKLNSSSPFRRIEAAHSIRLRAWAIHDGILDEPFTNVTMYKHVGKSAGITTCPTCVW
jgi:acetoin utilization protein AcuC